MKTNIQKFFYPIADLFIDYCSIVEPLEANQLMSVVDQMKTLTRQQLSGCATNEIELIVFTVIPAIKPMIADAIDPYYEDEEIEVRPRTRAEISMIEDAAFEYQRWLCACTIKTTAKVLPEPSGSFPLEVVYRGAKQVFIVETVSGLSSFKVWAPGICDLVISAKPSGAYYVSCGTDAGYGLLRALGKALRLLAAG